MENVIEVRDLQKSFRVRGKEGTVEAVRGVDLTVRRGEIYGFLGPNGAGKTTCQRMLTTLLPIGGGVASVAGFDVKKQPRKVRGRIGYVGQTGGADLPATGRENLMLAGRLYGLSRAGAARKIGELARLMEIEELLDRIVRTWSGGQKRRLEIALGIMHTPEILFMDEPTTGLDPQNRANLWAHIRTLKEQGMTIFLTTHYLDEADALADRLSIMDHGQIVAEGSPRELKRLISGDAVTLRLKSAGDAQKALAVLERREFIRSAETDGSTVYLYVADGAKVLPVLFEILKAHAIELDTISLSEPSLDDVFLKKTGRTLRDTGGETA